jgi:hypothetical protein
MNKWAVGVAVCLALLFPIAPAVAQGHGGGSGCGDVFGDLIHIKRDATTGQPILQKRWIEYPQDTYGWGYCPIAVDAAGEEIGFVELSCDPADADALVEVDYFGRLSGGRTKERNSRMHFDETIASIKTADRVRQDDTGRLELGYDCTQTPEGTWRCDEWKVTDSPMENLALYTRLMKYGHLQTDPLEVDIWAHGDPSQGTQYHPALGPEDWDKFAAGVRHLLPGDAERQPSDCFGPAYPDGFNAPCAAGERLRNRDLVRAASFLAGAADKTGKMTVDLVQYMNRILKIVLVTETTTASLDTLPALIRDCGDDPEHQITDPDLCAIVEGDPDMPPPANERFVDFQRAAYERLNWRDQRLAVIRPQGVGSWVEDRNVRLMAWLDFVNGTSPLLPVRNIDGFVAAASDGLRAIEFVHNYEIPEDLGWDFGF